MDDDVFRLIDPDEQQDCEMLQKPKKPRVEDYKNEAKDLHRPHTQAAADLRPGGGAL